MPKKTYEELLGFKKMQKVSVERLHPPMAPKPIASEISDEVIARNIDEKKGTQKDIEQSIDDLKLAIDYDDDYYYDLSKSSEFRRLEYLVRTGKTHRGTLAQLDKDLAAFHTKVRIVNEVPKDFIELLQSTKKKDYKECMNELKEKLRGRKIE